MNRTTAIERLRRNPRIPVLIVGAGINGIATFRDLALQGVEVMLVERGDYCSGASAASSHMVHGGIRYLENGEFRLVQEAVRERNHLIENMPHLVKPIPTVFPIFKLLSGLLNAPLKFLGLLDRPAERGALVIKIGMSLYDLFTRAQKTVPPHIFLGRKASLERFPEINPEVLFTGTYYDGTMPSPERICVELIQDALEHSELTWSANYLSVNGLQGDQVILVDGLTNEQLHAQPEILINAGGPWIDLIHNAMGIKSDMIGGTKGSHIILEHPELSAAIDGHEFFFENKDGRIVLINPLLDKVMIGTTDIRIKDPDQAVCEDEEIEYFFEMVARVFPGITVDRSQILYTFSGVRPLPSSPAGFTGQISRDHSIEVIPPGEHANFPILALVGGKWTSFRAFAEQTTDRVLELFNLERKVDTRSRISGGSQDYPSAELRWDYLEALSDRYNLPADQVEQLFHRYGTETTKVLANREANPELTESPIPGYYIEELQHLIREEDILHLDDLILRRTMIAKLGLLTIDKLTQLGDLVAQEKGWSAAYTADEIARTKAILRERHHLQL
jgi:glycerol-3-phosphate dehydrogenase